MALKDATGTTATFSTTTFTAPPVTGSAQDLDIPQTQINMASGLSWDLLENIFFKYYEPLQIYQLIQPERPKLTLNDMYFNTH